MAEGAVGAMPPVGNTGAFVTTESGEVGVHWLAGVTMLAVETVLSVVGAVTGDEAMELPRSKWYARRWQVGPVSVAAGGVTGDAESMGCHVEVSGSGCDVLGLAGIAAIYGELELRASRVDLAVDGCPFTPETVWTAWTAGQVRTRAKVARDALPGREWRSGEWITSATGDTAYLGGRQAARRVRVYNRRETGTRLELQARGKAAAAIAADVLPLVEVEGWGSVVLEHVRAFVDFVETETVNSSRRELLPWWSAFVGHVEKARVRFSGVVVDTLERVSEWLDGQVGPVLAVFAEVYGRAGMDGLLSRGRSRWRQRHTRLVRGAGV